ncbi:class I SAM-dependent methyltransferase [Acidicapsa dinghuensis]|uniref:Class I SAM-dependent methyltransferase n=1 Tax=Acidicapsa dinghuensis TaxID=2218256 RepID=A0ABW1EJY3_9BACT|nr:class I SAM-dependent methyltransferase [Acidicapsa dinghuensis]
MSKAPNFNRLALIYRWLEYLTFGPFLHRCRTHFLPHLEHCRNALILGDGDGRFTAALLRFNPAIHVTAIDASPAMLAALRKRCSPSISRLTTQTADLRQWAPDPSALRYDLVCTHFFLDCLSTEEIAAIAHRLTPVLAPNALWIISEFAIPSTAFGHFAAAPLVWLLYRAFRLLTGLRQQSLPGYPSALTASGWSLQSQIPQLRGLLSSQLWQRVS